MTIQIRLATCRDGPAIARICFQVFGERIAHDKPRVKNILIQEFTFVATSDGEVVGFVGNLFTLSARGDRRFELDLLAVAPVARGRGIGGRLVGHSLARARQSDARVLRTLVAARNLKMQRICAGYRFTRSDVTYALHVSEPRASDVATGAAHCGHLVLVDTLIYSGIWLEGALSPAVIDSGLGRAARAGLTRVGAVVPLADEETAALLRARRFEAIGEYHWWTITLQNG